MFAGRRHRSKGRQYPVEQRPRCEAADGPRRGLDCPVSIWRIWGDILKRADAPIGDPRAFEPLHDALARRGEEYRTDDLIEGLAILDPPAVVGKARIGCESGIAKDFGAER